MDANELHEIVKDLTREAWPEKCVYGQERHAPLPLRSWWVKSGHSPDSILVPLLTEHAALLFEASMARDLDKIVPGWRCFEKNGLLVVQDGGLPPQTLGRGFTKIEVLVLAITVAEKGDGR